MTEKSLFEMKLPTVFICYLATRQFFCYYPNVVRYIKPIQCLHFQTKCFALASTRNVIYKS